MGEELRSLNGLTWTVDGGNVLVPGVDIEAERCAAALQGAPSLLVELADAAGEVVRELHVEEGADLSAPMLLAAQLIGQGRGAVRSVTDPVALAVLTRIDGRCTSEIGGHPSHAFWLQASGILTVQALGVGVLSALAPGLALWALAILSLLALLGCLARAGGSRGPHLLVRTGYGTSRIHAVRLPTRLPSGEMCQGLP